jgi:hypothetical protein
MIRRIFLDLDDTCNTLAMHLLDITTHAVDPRDYQQYPTDSGFEVEKAANQLLGYVKYPTPADFWRRVLRTHWAECPTAEIFPWVLHRAAHLVGRENVYIATCPTKSPDCLAGKLDWIHRHLPPWTHRQYVITPRKHLLARPDALLIDDNEVNIQRFTAGGGHAVLVPRPWNRRWGEDPFEALEAQLEQFL